MPGARGHYEWILLDHTTTLGFRGSLIDYLARTRESEEKADKREVRLFV